MSDTPSLDFKVRTQSVRYGDRRTFFEYRILMLRRGRIVGVDVGPRRHTKSRRAALNAAHEREAFLKTRPLYVIAVTRKHIAEGDARDCDTCAIAQALWHNQERMGLPRGQWNFWVNPYGWGYCGIELKARFGFDDAGAPNRILEPKLFPDVVHVGADENVYPEGLTEWALRFDNWAESKTMSLEEWRDRHGAEPGERPYRPGPMSFVLDLAAFEPVEAA